MNITELFIRRPVMTTLVMLAILLFGVAGYRTLPVNDLPIVDFPTLQVSASLPGASPETMAASVATPLERQFARIPGIDSITSSSGRGNTNITLQFALDRDLDGAAQDVQSAISATLRRLPDGMPSPPSYRKVNPADAPILILNMSSPTMPIWTVDDYAENMVGQRISMINGVAQVDVMGAAKFAVRAQLDPNLVAARGIGFDEVATAMNEHNANRPTGTLWGPRQSYIVQAQGQLSNAAQYRNIIVTYRNGAPVYLGELGRVIDSVENERNVNWRVSQSAQERSISLQVERQPGVNTVEVVDRIRELLPGFRAQLPPSVKLELFYDRSQSIRESVRDVKYTLVLTVVLVILVIFLFLGSVSATAIPSLALPLSIVGTFAAMSLAGYTLDNLSLMALTLSVGFVMDDAIVILENIFRHMEMGKGRLEAALDGGREIGFTIVSMTLSLAAVFIPVLFMGGIIGRLFHEFAVVIMVAILISGFVSLSLTPMLCSRFLRPISVNKNAFQRLSDTVFGAMRDLYGWTLSGVLHHRLVTMMVAVGTLAGSVYLYGVVQKGFIPSQDLGQLSATTEAAQDMSFDGMLAAQNQVVKVIRDDAAIDYSTSMVSGGNNARMTLVLKSRDQRQDTPEQIIERLRPKLNAIPGVRVYLQNPPIIRIGGMMTRSLYQYTLQAADSGELYRVAANFEKRMRELPGLADVSSDMLMDSLQLTVDIDREHAASLGLNATQVEDVLYNAYGSRQVSNIYTENDTYSVILELLPKYQLDPVHLPLLYARNKLGKLIPISAVTRTRLEAGPLSVAHLGGSPSVTVSFNLQPGVSLGEAVDRVGELARETLPATVITSFQGTAAAFQSSFSGMGVLLVMAILVIYMVLGILYESFIHPLTILSGLPSAGLGALATLLVFHDELNLYSFVGIIMLIGIVKKNAIMMIDFALEGQREHGLLPADAIYEACLVRFRPIMMTTMAALMGTLPIALGLGAGGEARRPLGLAVVGGLVVSQLLTLYITPVFYIYMEKARGLRGRRKARPEQAVPAAVGV